MVGKNLIRMAGGNLIAAASVFQKLAPDEAQHPRDLLRVKEMNDENVLLIPTGNDDLDQALYHLRRAAMYFVFAGWDSEEVAAKAKRSHEILFYHMDSAMHKAEADGLSEEERGSGLAAAVRVACEQMAQEDSEDPVIQRTVEDSNS
jgi:hypothetical protein